MAELTLLQEGEFRASRYADIADNISGQLSDVIAQAEAHIETWLDRKIAHATYAEHYVLTQRLVYTQQYPITSITSFRVRRAPTDDWVEIDPNLLRVPYEGVPIIEIYGGHDYRGYEVSVVYEAGYDPVPPDVKAAVILQTVLLIYTDFDAYGLGDGQPPGIMYMQRDVYRYLEGYRRLQRVF